MTTGRLRAALLLAPIVALGLAILGPLRPAAAAEFAAEDSRIVGADETVDGSLYWAGTTLVVEGTIAGDLIVAGSDVTIDGVVEGALMGAAQRIEINGEVRGGARVGAERLTISGSVADELVVFGNTVQVSDGATVGGEIVGAMTQLSIGGTVGGDVQVGATSIVVNGTVEGSIDVQADTVRVGQAAVIGGDLTYRSANEAQIADGAEFGGTVERLDPAPQPDAIVDNPFLNLLGLWLGLLVLGWLTLLVRPSHLIGVGDQIRVRPLLSLGVGVLVWLGQIVALISLLVVAVIFAAVAAPLGGAFVAPILVVILLICILALMAQVYVAAGIGLLIAGRVEISPYLAYAAGALIWAVVFVLASVVNGALGALLYFAAWFLALGALALHLIDRRRAEAVVVVEPVAAPPPAQAPAAPPPPA